MNKTFRNPNKQSIQNTNQKSVQPVVQAPQVEYKTFKFTVAEITFIGKTPAEFNNAGSNWFNIKVAYITNDGYKRIGYIKAYLDYLRVEGNYFIYSNKPDAVLNVFDLDLKQPIQVPYKNIVSLLN